MNTGVIHGALAFALWGVLPLYFKQLQAVPPLEIVLHRSVWSLVFVLGVLAVLRRWAWLTTLWRAPRQAALFGVSALLLSGNWLLFVWAVNNGRIVEASLGYFINPLVSVLLGYAVLHERLRRVQWMAVALAAAGVLWLTLQTQQWPWVSLLLAASFGVYGLLRKTASLGALEGLALETLLLAPVTVPLLASWTWQGGSALSGAEPTTVLWLLLAGPLTAAPLLLFASAARRISLATVGLLQYIGPTIQLGLGVWLYGEPFGGARATGFALIWLALALYSAESGWRLRADAISRR